MSTSSSPATLILYLAHPLNHVTQIHDVLTACGDQVILAAPHAISLTDHPDVVLLDFINPNAPYEEVLRTAQAARVPVIALVECPEDKLHALEKGADDAVAAPWSALELRARCQAVTRHRRATRCRATSV